MSRFYSCPTALVAVASLRIISGHVCAVGCPRHYIIVDAQVISIPELIQADVCRQSCGNRQRTNKALALSAIHWPWCA